MESVQLVKTNVKLAIKRQKYRVHGRLAHRVKKKSKRVSFRRMPQNFEKLRAKPLDQGALTVIFLAANVSEMVMFFFIFLPI